uniref:Uncharacterized protein n=1 Tax=Arundo donax TaxID=35708 RepID=A0A0A9GUN9_ARUDO
MNTGEGEVCRRISWC